MSRTKSIFLKIAILLIMLVNKIYADVNYSLGDVNGDGDINKSDALLIAKYIINDINLSDNEFNANAADVNNDGIIKMNDAMLILSDKIDETKTATEIVLDESVINIANGSSKTIKGTIYPSDTQDKTISWTSSNNDVASVNNSGNISAKNPGVVTITATTSNGKTASATVIVNKYSIYDSYSGSTLKYWIERPNNNYIITRIWTEDAYNQMKVAMTNEMTKGLGVWYDNDKYNAKVSQINACFADENRNYKLYKPTLADDLINNEISKKEYENKGMVAINASAPVSELFYLDSSCDWFGTAAIPIVINDGKIIRDSTNGTNYASSNIIYGLTKDKELKYYSFTKGETEEQISSNQQEAQKIINDGVKYTYGFRGILVKNNKVNTTNDTTNIRQSICQIDNHNYIFISSTLTSTDQSIRENNGLSYKSMAEEMVSYGCKVGYNLDGGGSEVFFYKKNDNKIKDIRVNGSRSYDGRELADLLYFVEK